MSYSAVAEAVPATIMVEVESPATLSAGFKFDAIYDGQTFPVTVPEGGVMKGQKITVPFTPEATALDGEHAPLGHWKDGLCDCFRFGICHPHLCCAWFFPEVLMGQVLTRMKMNWCGDYAPESEWRSTYRKMIYVFVVYVIIMIIFPSAQFEYKVIDDEVYQVPTNSPTWMVIVNNIANLAFGLYSLIILTKLRRAVRERDHIPEEKCGGCEDCCCALFCGCCTVAQVARQTTDYEVQEAKCCSDTGLKPKPPVMVV